MKTLRFISTFVMLALATVVTAGSMYVTVNAAAQQEATDAALAPVAPAEAKPLQETPPATEVVPGLEAAILGIEPALDKTQILRGRQNHVILDENGGFTGRLSSLRQSDGEQVPAANLKVVLAHHGAVVGSTTTDVSGRFSFTGLSDGVVAIWAESEDKLLLFSFVLFGKDSAIEENAGLVAAQIELDMDSAVAFAGDLATVRELMTPYLSIEDKRFAGELAVEEQDFSFGAGDSATTIHYRPVRLQKDGSLKGEINILDERNGRHREVLDMTVHFVANGVVAASSKVSHDGSFIATGLTPGVYSVVAVGQDGILVCAVEAVDPNHVDQQAQNAGPGEFIAASVVADSLGFSGSPVGPMNLAAFYGSAGGGGGPGPGYPPNANSGSGGGGSGSGGGGGGAAGGGGLGALLAGGLGAAAGFAAGNKNNDAPASPGI